MTDALRFLAFIFLAGLFGFVIFLIVKQIQFIVSAIPLYKQMVANQERMISALSEATQEIRNLKHSNGQSAVKEIKL